MAKMTQKYMFSAAIAIPISWLAEGLRYIYQDWEFAKWIAVAIVLDTILGFAKAWVNKDISSEEFMSRFGKKILVYLSLLILSNILQNYTVKGSSVGATEWMGNYLCSFMLVREAVSILENVNAITPIVPKWLLERMRDFTEKGKTTKEEEDEV
jgi:toxin secretion/phage lysis holin